jgi:hypothetical protein
MIYWIPPYIACRPSPRLTAKNFKTSLMNARMTKRASNIPLRHYCRLCALAAKGLVRLRGQHTSADRITLVWSSVQMQVSPTLSLSHQRTFLNADLAAGLNHPDATYQDVLVEILTRYDSAISRPTLPHALHPRRFLQSECKSQRVQTMAPGNTALQATATDLLQALVGRGEVEALALEMLEAAVIGKLYTCVHTCRLELQNKLLHLLHSVISATNAGHQARRAGLSASGDTAQDAHAHAVNPLLVHTLVDGLSVPSNRSTLQHWLDFVLMTIPQFQSSMHAVVTPLSDCVGRQLRLCLSDILQASEPHADDSARDVHSVATDAEFLMLLNALERLILLNLQASDMGSTEDDGVPAEKPGSDGGSGILGMVTNVFASEAPSSVSDNEQLTVRTVARAQYWLLTHT